MAERVMIFERCPVFNPADPAKDVRVGTGGFPPGSLSISNEKKKEPIQLQINTSWRNNANEVQVGLSLTFYFKFSFKTFFSLLVIYQ